MCLECFVFPWSDLSVFDWVEFFPFGVCRTGHTALENIENIAIDQNQQIIMVLYGYSGGTQTLDIDARARGNGEHSNGNEHPGEFERVYGRTKS